MGGRFEAARWKPEMTREYPIKGVQANEEGPPGLCQGPEATCTQESGEECRVEGGDVDGPGDIQRVSEKEKLTADCLQ